MSENNPPENIPPSLDNMNETNEFTANDQTHIEPSVRSQNIFLYKALVWRKSY